MILYVPKASQEERECPEVHLRRSKLLARHLRVRVVRLGVQSAPGRARHLRACKVFWVSVTPPGVPSTPVRGLLLRTVAPGTAVRAAGAGCCPWAGPGTK